MKKNKRKARPGSGCRPPGGIGAAADAEGEVKEVEDPILQALQAYLKTCPLMAGGRLRCGGSPAQGIAWRIGGAQKMGTVRRYFRGCLRQSTYVLSAAEDLTAQELRRVRRNACKELTSWIRRQARARHLPRLPEGMTAQSLEVQAPLSLSDAGGEAKALELLCRIVYFQTEQEDMKQ